MPALCRLEQPQEQQVPEATVRIKEQQKAVGFGVSLQCNPGQVGEPVVWYLLLRLTIEDGTLPALLLCEKPKLLDKSPN